MKKDSKIFYPARGTTIREGQVQSNRTQYGWTSTYCNLLLHMGDHLYRKRGGLQEAFLFDKTDYRYVSLQKSMGIYSVPAKGGLIGNYIDMQGDVIRFRVTEDNPTHVVFCYDYDGDDELLKKLADLHPVALSVAQTRRWLQAVFPLDRINDTEDIYADYFDDDFDLEPDVADLYHYHANKEVDSDAIIETRLCLFGFN